MSTPEPPRRRNSLLEALSIVRSLHPAATVNEVIVFLYVCENEGLSVQDLARVAGLHEPTASRAIRTFGPAGSPWGRGAALGLVQAFRSPADHRARVLRLTEAGRDLRERLEAVIAAATPIGSRR